MSNLVKYAQYMLSELKKEHKKNGSESLIQNLHPEIIALAKKFSKDGHSGVSGPYAAVFIGRVISKVLSYETLVPINNTPDEWELCHRDKNAKKNIYQNKKCFSVFKDGAEGKPYMVDAIIFRKRGFDFTHNGKGIKDQNRKSITSAQYINKFPFWPKKFIVNVTKVKIELTGRLEDRIKDPKQLERVFKYYDRKNK
jgi:hypothetical protein